MAAPSTDRYQLHTITTKVQQLLEDDFTARSDDYYLFFQYCLIYHDIDLHKISASDYFLNRQGYGLPNYDSISRARRKVQMLHPELKPDFVEVRQAQEQVYREYATEEEITMPFD